VNLIAATDLLYPNQPDPIGWQGTGQFAPPRDSLRYVVWVDAGRLHGRDGWAELAPRLGLHLVAVRNGKEAG
jgi:hypothetical protein